MLDWALVYRVSCAVALVTIAAGVWSLSRVLTSAVAVLRCLRADLEGLSGALEQSAGGPARPAAASDAPHEPAAVLREAVIPRLQPQDIAPALRRPPRPPGGFGSRVGD